MWEERGSQSRRVPPCPVAKHLPFLPAHRPVCSFTEKNCSYFRHFNPGESSEIFEFTTQKGEAFGSRGGGKQFLSQAAEPLGVTWQNLLTPVLDGKQLQAMPCHIPTHQGWFPAQDAEPICWC